MTGEGEFEASLDLIARPCFKKGRKNRWTEWAALLAFIM